MKITDIRIREMFDSGSLKAIVSVVFDGEFVVHDIKLVVTGEDNRFLMVMPATKLKNDKFKDICHPMSARMRAYIEGEILKAYNEMLETPEEYRRQVRNVYSNNHEFVYSSRVDSSLTEEETTKEIE